MSLLWRRLIFFSLLINVWTFAQEPTILQRSLKTKREQNAAREAWFRHGRTLTNQSSATLRFQAYQQKLLLRNPTFKARTQTGVTAADVVPQMWQPLGPAPLASDASGFGQQDYGWVSGRATSVVIDRSDPSGNTVYLGGAFGGVWKSSNAASLNSANVVWTPLIDDQPTLAVGTIAIQPQVNNPDPSHSVVLVGTGETNSSTDSYYGLGVLRSTNGGASWNLISQDVGSTHSFAGIGFSKIAFSTANPNLVVAATAGASQGLIDGLANPPSPNLGIYYSTNGGASWNFASMADSGIVVPPGSVTSVAYNDATSLFIAAVRSHGFYSSTDGSHWSRLANQPGPGLSSALCPPTTAGNCPIYRGEIAAVAGRNEMYVWYIDANDTDQGIWKTTDAGNSWTQISTTAIDSCGDALAGCGTENGGYNLTLNAVANGATATDLYAGAINLYKCSINSQSQTCSGPNTFLNLTHVFGCNPNFGALAHVHPAQHAIDSLVINGKSLLYFANDGGAYRALDGYMGLTSSDCGSNNQFDNLNQTLGSMTQFVSFAQHPSDANTLLGGAQGNGSPATANTLAGSGWRNVNSGDGGFSEINPASPTEWFTSNPGVNIQKCTAGVECHAQDFAANPVISPATLDGDAGPFYTPFILDPQNSSEIIVGTCRLWRGGNDGTGFTTLSNNLDTGSPSTCSGNEANLVRSVAAGGPQNISGLSQVIYAGTDGFGPLVTTMPAAGRIWVSKNADGGPSTWADRTGTINPQHFPVSNIAVDPSDANGTTAYAAIMGFHVPHVWMTPSAGVSWFNFTGNLPDVPVNAVLVDPGPDPLSGTIYVGTDVGVFASSTASPNWTEVGPSAGQAGFLPNVPVTALRIFKSGTTKLLRASTYGRGLWQFALSISPDFQIAVPDPIQTIYPSQNANFNVSLTAINGYNSSVSLSCVAGATPAPTTCSVSPSVTIPSSTLTVATSGALGDYFFKLHAVGAPPSNIVHDAPITLHVVDFNLTAPTPTAISVDTGNTSQPVQFQVTPQGNFQGNVNLTCSGLPSGATCNFFPSDIVSPTANAPAAVTLTIGAANNTPPGAYSVLIHGLASGSTDKTQTLTVTVAAKQDYALNIANPQLAGSVNTSFVFNGSVSASNGYNSPVNLNCGNGAPPTCVVSPATVTPSVSGTAFTLTVSSNVVQNYPFDIVALGTDVLATAHSALVNFQTTFDFSFTVTPNSRQIPAGQAANYVLDMIPDGGRFVSAVTFSCANLPAKTNCSFSPTQIPSNVGERPIQLTISTTATTVAQRQHAGYLYAFCLPAFLFLLIKPRQHNRRGLLFATVILVLLPHFGCGGSGLQGNGNGGGNIQPGTTPGTYIITVTAAAGTVTHSNTVTLTVQ
ncbi:MAG TPA: hypothetical protein VIW67_26200 [Terriglobales bacterium]